MVRQGGKTQVERTHRDKKKHIKDLEHRTSGRYTGVKDLERT